MSQLNNKVVIFSCGGAAINAASVFETCRNQQEIGAASVEVVYLDTSSANFNDKIPESARFVVPGDKDGSGGDRRENSAVIAQSIDALLSKFKPGYCNIVLSSGSGGSGSVIAPNLVSRLIDREVPVIPMIIGDARQGHWIKNTLGTLATYEKISAVKKTALAVGYFENTQDTPPTTVDRMIADLVVAIGVLYSRQNEGIDTRDLHNFLHFDRMTSYAPHCGLLEWMTGAITEENGADIMTAVSVTVDKDDTGIGIVLPYAKQGVLPEKISVDIKDRSPLHLVTRAYPFNDISDRLKAELRRLEEEARARTKTSTVTAGMNLGDSDDIMVF